MARGGGELIAAQRGELATAGAKAETKKGGPKTAPTTAGISKGKICLAV
jgi:hypothetical protein